MRKNRLPSNPIGPFTLQQFLVQGPINIEGNSYLQQQSERESNARSYPRQIPIALEQAGGVYVRDTKGQTFIDCLAGAGALALGHNHPVTIDAIKRTLDSGLPLQTLDLTTPVKEQFVEELFAALPPAFSQSARIQFCGPTGSDAVEAAMKLVQTATSRKTIMGFSGGYHGMTQGSLSVTGKLEPKLSLGSIGLGVQFLPYPYNYRCPFGLGGDVGIDAGLRYIEHLLTDSASGVLPPAAIILEIVQGEGGVIPAPIRWLQGIRRITRSHGIPLIIDEVQTGLGRTGKLFAFQHADIEPDVLVLSKAIGGGLPLSVVVYNKSLDRWSPGAHAGTFRGNQLAMAAGTATLRYIVQENLSQHAEEMGQRLMQHLLQIKQQYACIGDVRGRGLMIGIEIVNTQAEPDALGALPPDPTLARLLQQHCLRLGILFELGGRKSGVVRFLPPLIIQPEEIDEIAKRFHRALKQAIDYME